jgi:DNA polymerase III subunit gamma/tau
MAKRKSGGTTAEPPPNPADSLQAANRGVSASGTQASSQAQSADGYTVLARRYRPQQFAELVGQEAVVQALVNALSSNRVAHAYLFTGARGVGKTSTARILAKALNCVKGPTITPCDECEICKSIAAGEDIDVLEIDGASNRGIDEVRNIRQNVLFRPSRSRFKIYIVDEVHMLTPAAFNALLKTLEEPPAHVKFIFATTEVQKIPATILSRCQRFDFAGIGTSRIVERLREVVAAEGMQADDEALELIARRASGSMRDAQSLLDQLLSFGSDRLTPDRVHQLLGTAHDDQVFALASAALAHDAKQALELFSKAQEEGLQAGELVDQLTDYWRDLMVARAAGNEARDLSVPPRHRETLIQQANALSLDSIMAGLDILENTKARLRFSSHPRVLMEMALVRLGLLDNLISLTQLAQWLEQERPGQVGKVDSAKAPPATARTHNQAASRETGIMPSGDALKKKPIVGQRNDGPMAVLPLTVESLPRLWQEVLEKLPTLLAKELARAGLPAISGPNALVLRFPLEYNSARDYIDQPGNAARIETLLQNLTGTRCHLRFEWPTAPAQKPPTDEDREGSQSPYRRRQAEAFKEPLIRKAIERMGAQILEVDEGFGGAAPSPTEDSSGQETEDE